MILEIHYYGEISEIDIKSINELKKELLEYSGYFIPDEDDYAIDLLEKNYFDELIDELEEYYAHSFFLIAKEYFLALKDIYASSDINFIKEKVELINSICDKAGYDLKYRIK